MEKFIIFNFYNSERRNGLLKINYYWIEKNKIKIYNEEIGHYRLTLNSLSTARGTQNDVSKSNAVFELN